MGLWAVTEVKLTASVVSFFKASSLDFCDSSMKCWFTAAVWSSIINHVSHGMSANVSSRLETAARGARGTEKEGEKHTRTITLHVLPAMLSEIVDLGFGNVALVAILVDAGEANVGVSGV